MNASSHTRFFGRALPLLVSLVVAASTAVAGAPLAVPPPPLASPAEAVFQPVAMDTLPTVPQQRRGGGRRRAKEKDKPYQPLAKDPAGESAAAHKEYLKRYGF